MEDIINIRINPMKINSIQSFANIKGGFIKGIKNVYFIRIIGIDEKDNYLNDIYNMDKLLSERNNQYNGYLRINSFPTYIDKNDMLFYTSQYENFIKNNTEDFRLKNIKKNMPLFNIYLMSLKNIKKLFKNKNVSILKNFIIELFFWSDCILPKLIGDTNKWNEKNSYKFVFTGNLKKHEYYFLYFLTQIGVDVMYMNTEKDLDFEKEILELSELIKLNSFAKIDIPLYKINETSVKNLHKQDNKTKNTKLHTNINTQNTVFENKNKRKELDFEQIAKMASSVVMISVYNNSENCIKTGSGVMINKDGYILTNYHVISGGSYYTVNIEGENNVYTTNEIIKYNNYTDLSLIRIDRQLNPINVYNEKNELSRGQKVVAIGSPLGLFNSVSDGIISGFRNIDNVNMIQFTAPISHGSSGGALLNLYGELIGISTAGFDDGQNINLAVDYKTILNFIKGFIK